MAASENSPTNLTTRPELVQIGQISGAPIFAGRRIGGGVSGTMKNIIFAADGPKPKIVLGDAVNNDIQRSGCCPHATDICRRAWRSPLTIRSPRSPGAGVGVSDGSSSDTACGRDGVVVGEAQPDDDLGEGLGEAGVLAPDRLLADRIEAGDLGEALVSGLGHGGELLAGDRVRVGGLEGGGAVHVLDRGHRRAGGGHGVAGAELVAVPLAHVAGGPDPAPGRATPGGVGRRLEPFQAVAPLGRDHANDPDGAPQPVTDGKLDAGGDVGVADLAPVVAAQPDITSATSFSTCVKPIASRC
ncbi:AbiJ-related protein [Nonomuraea angiospora]|uniref:AbiJ-related protein n=1 Tax=Nonomuraea angiospora TaxID=46172 RepID=UPI0029BF7500|nr:hypothetical protein [Nonomuraea angiospora]MDX3107678.1 hypothetical protein [Nonomuraea angiospora]